MGNGVRHKRSDDYFAIIIHDPGIKSGRIYSTVYISIKEYSSEWGLSIKYVQLLCRQGKIEGAIKEKGKWLIPEDADKPEDHRVISGKYKGWRKKYNVDCKIDKDLQKIIDDTNENAILSQSSKEIKKKLVFIINK